MKDLYSGNGDVATRKVKARALYLGIYMIPDAINMGYVLIEIKSNK